MATTAIIGGAALGAVGQAGGGVLGALLQPGGILNKQDAPELILSSPQRFNTDPLAALASFDALLALGQVDPQLLLQSSPLQRSLSQFQASPQKRKAREIQSRIINEIVNDVVNEGLTIREAILKQPDMRKALNLRPGQQVFASEDEAPLEVPEPTPFQEFFGLEPELGPAPPIFSDEELIDRVERSLNQFLSTSGFPDLPSLIEAEQNFQADVQPLFENLTGLQQDLRQGRLDLLGRRNDLLQNLPDASAAGIESFREQERDRILGDVEDARLAALRQANITGVNPGRQLADLDEFVADDVELDSLRNAITLLGGRQDLAASDLALIDAGLQTPLVNATNLAALRTSPGGFASTLGGQAPFNPNTGALLAQGIGGGFDTLGAGIVQAGVSSQLAALERERDVELQLLSGLIGSNRPAAGP